MDLKDDYLKINNEYWNLPEVYGNIPEIEDEIEERMEAVPDLIARAALDIDIGRLCVASEYKGFILGLIAAHKNADICRQIASMIDKG